VHYRLPLPMIFLNDSFCFALTAIALSFSDCTDAPARAAASRPAMPQAFPPGGALAFGAPLVSARSRAAACTVPTEPPPDCCLSAELDCRHPGSCDASKCVDTPAALIPSCIITRWHSNADAFEAVFGVVMIWQRASYVGRLPKVQLHFRNLAAMLGHAGKILLINLESTDLSQLHFLHTQSKDE
jgi:hypothetical protein